MVSTYTPNKNLEKPGNGDYVDTWNVPMNGDMSIIDKSLGGVLNLNATSGSALLTTSQYQNLILNVTGAMSASVTYTIPAGVGGQWIVRNATTDATGGPWTVTIASGGAGYSVVAIRGKSITVWSDGTNIRVVDPNVPSFGTVTSVGVSGGTTGLTTTGGPVTTAGTITLGGVLGTANGGTGLTALGTGVQAALALPALGTGSIVLSGNPFNPEFAYVIEPVQTTAFGVTGTIPFYVYNGSIFYSTGNAAGNWTVNLTFSNSTTLDSTLAVGQGLTCAFLAKQGATPYYVSSVQVDGATLGVATYWQGGSAPTSGNANSIDIYTFTVIKTNTATFNVFATQTQFA